MLIESKELIWLQGNTIQRRQRKTEERHGQRSRLVGTWRQNCSGGTTAAASSCEVSRLGATLVRSPDPDHEGWLRWTYDTSAAILAFPLDARIGTETQANDCSHKTAPGELISCRGGLCVRGTTEYGCPVEESRRTQNSDQRERSSQ